MSKWISEMVEDKLHRQARGPLEHGRLKAVEGSKLMDGLVIGEPLIDKIRRLFRQKPRAPQLRVLKSMDE